MNEEWSEPVPIAPSTAVQVHIDDDGMGLYRFETLENGRIVHSTPMIFSLGPLKLDQEVKIECAGLYLFKLTYQSECGKHIRRVGKWAGEYCDLSRETERLEFFNNI